MTLAHDAFVLVEERFLMEINSQARLFEHKKSGARLLSLTNTDENKVFGIAFRTPPSDSTGVAHILEHSVLCGSRKYPVKEPFVELLRGSLQTFLNAMTYPDKTCYPVASQNTRDLYNLIDVYLDAVFYPRISKDIFFQEGWHLELENQDAPLTRKGVVYNEMKGAYSSPEGVLAEFSQRHLFPDTAYGLDSGGEPAKIPDLTYERFKDFHSRYYHPSNSWIYMYGDDDEQQRLDYLDSWLKEFSRREVDSRVTVQALKKLPEEVRRPYAVGQEAASAKSMLTVNWLLPETTDAQTNFALAVLEHILIGTAGSPLRKALLDCGLGEDLTGVGMERELRQMFFSVGLKGIEPGQEEAVKECIIATLEQLVSEGIDAGAIEAGINTVEFALRENNTGSYPRGLHVMLRSLTTWLYDASPFLMLEFEPVLAKIKQDVANGRYFEGLIQKLLLENMHRTVLVLEPDTELGRKQEEEEREILARIRSGLSFQELNTVIEETARLQAVQAEPDSVEALATIPFLRREDMPAKNKILPGEFVDSDQQIFTHELDTNGILYLDLGFDLRVLPQSLLSFAGLLGQAMLEMGTEDEDYVSFTQRIDRKTGGIYCLPVVAHRREQDDYAARLFFRGKAVSEHLPELFELLGKALFESRLDDVSRFKQIVLEAKAGMEQGIIPAGHQLVALRLCAGFSRADWVREQFSGVDTLFFLRRLLDDLEKEPEKVMADLRRTRELLLSRGGLLVNLTGDSALLGQALQLTRDFFARVPERKNAVQNWPWQKNVASQGLGIPARVNYVGQGCNLFDSGYRYHGSAMAVLKYLRTSWLWEQVRVLGGAYGVFCSLNRLSGVFTFGSYRDPNLAGTLKNFVASARFLQDKKLEAGEVDKAVIGAIGDMDGYLLPDAKGFASLRRFLAQVSELELQTIREELLATTAADFQAFGQVLEQALTASKIVVAGAVESLQQAESNGVHFQDIVPLL